MTITPRKELSPSKKEPKALGTAGDAQVTELTTDIEMTDEMRFTPDWFDVKKSENIKMRLKDEGKMSHEFAIGTKKELDERAVPMLKLPTMEHEEPYMAHVPEGKTSEIIWTFNRAGDFDFASLITGHCQAGMAGKVPVAAKLAVHAL